MTDKCVHGSWCVIVAYYACSKPHFSLLFHSWRDISKTSVIAFIRDSKHEKTDERTRPQIVFECLDSSMKLDERLFEVASRSRIMNQEQRKKI